MPKDSEPPVRSHRCLRCDRVFSRSEHLQRHERSHTKETPFQCHHCAKAFTRKDLLTRHHRIAHPPEATSGPPCSEGFPALVYPSPQTAPSLNQASTSEAPIAPPSLIANQSGTSASTGGIVSSYASPERRRASAVEAQPYGGNPKLPEVDLALPLGFPPEEAVGGLAARSMDDFTSFMDSVPIPTHPFSPTYQPVPLFFQDADVLSGIELGVDGYSHGTWPGDLLRQPAPNLASTPCANLEPSLSQLGSRLPSVQPDGRFADDTSHRPDWKSKNHHLLVSAQCRERVINDLRQFSTIIDKDFALPSRHVLSRFLGGYFSTFHDHFPFLHIPTFEPGKVSVELFLAIMSLGARYTRELEISVDSFHAAKAIVLERIRRHREARPTRGLGDLDRGTVDNADPTASHFSNRRRSLPWNSTKEQVVEIVETVLLLVAVTTWSQPGWASDVLSMRGLLDCLIREEEILRVYESPPPDDWEGWICHENLKRILFVAFCFLNIHTIAFDVPPLILVSDLSLDLPCSEREWRAENAIDWKATRDTAGQPRQDFRAAFACLFVDGSAQSQQSKLSHRGFSSLGGCALVHALIQQIWLVRNARLPHLRGLGIGLSQEEMGTFEAALTRWAVYWERNQESSMDPLSPYGPVAFTSVALLRLAYIRLNLDLGPIRCLGSWDPQLIAQSLHESPPVQRCEKLTRAALHCAHALSIPVKLGLNHIAHTQVLYWSNQHALCSLECALLLAKWLESVTAADLSPCLTPTEERLLKFVAQLVADTEYKVSCEEVLQRKSLLNAMTVRLWARLYQSKSVWEMVDLIGRSLNVYAGLLEQNQ